MGTSSYTPPLLGIRRPFVWLSRFRHRRGYGVHSPFAFGLITDVVYERHPYYAYSVLDKEESPHLQPGFVRCPRKVNHLLFRLVNRVQPRRMVEVGCASDSGLYLRGAKPSAAYSFSASPARLHLDAGEPVDFLYLNDYRRPRLVREAFELCVGHATPRSLFVVGGIHYSRAMQRLWRALQSDGRVGVTFDLYDVGLLFFDLSKVKQHYIVNF